METALRGVFPNDDQYWRIEWVDGVYKNPKVPSERLIGVTIAPLKAVAIANHPTPLEALDTDANQRRVVRVGAGSIPSLIVGSVWRYRKMLPIVAYQQRTFQVDLAPATIQMMDAGYAFEPKRWLIPPFRYGMPPLMAQSKCAAVTIQSDSYALIIPCFEVLRAWFIRSSAMANILFSGPLRSVRDKLYDIGLSGIVDGSWRVQLRTGLAECDALPAALLACDPAAFLRAGKLVDAIISSHLKGQVSGIEILPPSCTGLLRVRGVDLSVGGIKRFLAFDLTEIPYPAPAENILWDLDNSNARDPEGEQRPSNGWRGHPRTRSVLPSDVISHVEEPDNKSGLTHDTYSAPRISTPVKLSRLPSSRTAAVAAAPRPPDSSDTFQHSTGRGTYGPTESRRLSIVAGADTATTPPQRKGLGFETVLGIRRALRCYPDTKCEPVAAGRSLKTDDGVVSLFPKSIEDKKYSWCFVQGDQRQAFVLEIHHANLFGYAIEIERRPAKKPDAKGERFRLGFISAKGQSRIECADLGNVLIACASNDGVWPEEGSSIEGHELSAYNHTRTPEQFADLLLNELRRRAGMEPLAAASTKQAAAAGMNEDGDDQLSASA